MQSEEWTKTTTDENEDTLKNIIETEECKIKSTGQANPHLNYKIIFIVIAIITICIHYNSKLIPKDNITISYNENSVKVTTDKNGNIKKVDGWENPGEYLNYLINKVKELINGN